MKYVYIVIIRPEYAMPTITNSAYDSLEKAQRYIECRSDMPKRVNDYRYKGRQYDYTIQALALR